MKAPFVRSFLFFALILCVCQNLSAQSYTSVFLGSGHQTDVWGVNDSGMSVGRKGISYAAALLWSPNGAVQDLGTCAQVW